jgi:hypothetical protein
MLSRAIKDFIQRSPALRELLRILRTRQVLLLEFPIHPRPRWGHGQPPHPELNAIIAQGRAVYTAWLHRFLELRADLRRIPLHASRKSDTPAWRNGYLTGLDAVALYGFLACTNPKRYMEIGSGHSTRFARQAIRDRGLRTAITSIDPHPRARIDALADTVVRQPLENFDLGRFNELEPGDIVFFDGSHRCFMNSDVTVFFLEVLPRLGPGVLVHVHDITLPYDYPPSYARRHYSEQYLLAVYLLAGGGTLAPLLPSTFCLQDPELRAITEPFWRELQLPAPGGCSFWLERR